MTRLRVLIALVVLGLVATACGTEADVDRSLLRYGYTPGDALIYDTSGSVTGSIIIDGEIEPGVPGGTLTLDLQVGARIGYSVFEGSDPTISIVRITQQLTALDGAFTGMGQDETISLADLGEDAPPSIVEVTIDAQGTVLGVAVDGTDLPLGDLGGLGDLTGLGGIGDLGGSLLDPQHIGPQLPDEPVGVGDDWTIDLDVAPFGFSFAQEARYEVTARETLGARSTLEIAGRTTTDAVDLDLADLAENLLGGGDTEDLGIDPDQLGDFLEAMGIRLALSLERTEGTSTSWFDPLDGIVVRHDMTSPLAMSLEMSGMPDVGDLAMHLDVTVNQSVMLVE